MSLASFGTLLVCGLTARAMAQSAGEASVTRSAPDESAELGLSRLAALEAGFGNGGSEPSQTALLAGWDRKNGFHIRDAADDFRLRLAGRLQVRYTYELLDSRANGGDGRDVSAFELERARFGGQGHFLDPRFAYKIEMDAHTDGDGANLTDAYLYFREVLGEGNQLLNIGGGQFKVPFLRQEKTSSGSLQFVDRGLVSEFFNLDRNIGVWVDGTMDSVEWTLAVTNGFDTVNRSTQNVDQSPAVILRLDCNVFRAGGKNMKMSESDLDHTETPALVIGTAFATDANNGTAERQLNAPGFDPEFKVYTWEVDAAFKYMGLSLQGEYVARWLNYDANAPTTRGDTIFAHGVYGQAGFFIVPQTIEIALRGGVVWSEGRPQKGAGVEFGPAFSWFISRDHRVKLQVDSSYVDIPSQMQHTSEGLQSGKSLSSSATALTAGDQGVITRVQVTLSW